MRKIFLCIFLFGIPITTSTLAGAAQSTSPKSSDKAGAGSPNEASSRLDEEKLKIEREKLEV